MPVFLIFSANKIESISTGGEFSNVEFNETTQYKEKHLRENEGTMNLEHAKSWFPTFGYNLQAAHNLSHRMVTNDSNELKLESNIMDTKPSPAKNRLI